MPKILITADLHLYTHRNDERRASDGLECLKWIYSTAKEHAVEYILFAGDFFHSRHTIRTDTYASAVEIVSSARAKGLETIFLLGNHDMYFEDRWDIHSLKGFQQWSTVVDKPSAIDFGDCSVDLLPYTPNPSEYLKSLAGSNNVLISHLAVADAKYNSSGSLSVEEYTEEKEVVKADSFLPWKKVWLGHYHLGQSVSGSHVEYVGSPMQLNFGEAGQKKHIVIFDPCTLEATYIENKFSPRFVICSDEEIDSFKTEELASSYVQVKSELGHGDRVSVREKLKELGTRHIEFRRSGSNVVQETKKAMSNIDSYINDTAKLVDTYVDNVDTGEMDPERLKSIGKEIFCSD